MNDIKRPGLEKNYINSKKLSRKIENPIFDSADLSLYIAVLIQQNIHI